eukprot:CAMPEP_0117006272 /NCGR_PEP_ID=MMETSP0472-20121206/6556_1 /TAXON_ID=693140 ORGANISM="Tiarina fusus, Strain LIS" /NCGR_SAMPLE_ID=MMETSP0472 /ASSEMBLY_ACC=CAM_ASM_000603 /LENGTH=97 /DNA_ID=CAMNT_0004707683 /DNA_START=44 /DNA_END=337 /DNA_ORIENTATION=-
MTVASKLYEGDRLFPFIQDGEETRLETIKWRAGNASYEIHISSLDSIELRDLVPHCLTYKAKIQASGVTQAQQGPTMFREFDRTLSMVLKPIWDQVL